MLSCGPYSFFIVYIYTVCCKYFQVHSDNLEFTSTLPKPTDTYWESKTLFTLCINVGPESEMLSIDDFTSNNVSKRYVA